jgi:L-ascorbate metabolism protein UlaG (beta-lactamase superfamily)
MFTHRSTVEPIAKRRLTRTLLVSSALVAGFVAFGCANLGRNPSPKQQLPYAQSPNFSAETRTFLNRPDPVVDSFWDANRLRFREGVNTSFDGYPPDFNLPMATPDFAAFNARDKGLQVVWIGHSSLALKVDSTVILLDPVFGRASPLPFYKGRRFHPPPFTRDDLPPVDVIVISHDHYDHLERATVEYYAKRNTTFIVPLGVSSHLLYWGVKRERIVERDWWDSVTLRGLEFIATPTWHSSGRRKRGSSNTQWASWVIRSAKHSVYFTGDTGYGSHFAEIGERFGPFDVVFLENGQYAKPWRSHLWPEHWPMVMRDLRSVNWFSIHWGTFSFAPHAWDDPIIAADTLARQHGFNLMAPMMGQVVDLENPPPFTRWWVRPAGN